MDTPGLYTNVITFEHSQRGSYGDMTYRPTFRASAIFFVIVNEQINTVVSFMNYWRVKNHNASVSALVTFRDSEGNKLTRRFFHVTDATYRLDARAIMNPAAQFIGSMEVELHSTEDLKYAFPALDAFYISRDGVSFVHSNQRTFNDVEDLDRNAGINAWQTGFDIRADQRLTGYLAVINGSREVKHSHADIKIYNCDGEAMRVAVPLGDFAAFGARLILFSDIPGVRQFLKDRIGFCKVNVDTFGIFMRIACGVMTHDQSRMAVTHSYYDCNDQQEYYDASSVEETELAAFLPFSLVQGLDLELIFYPMYAPARMEFSLACFDQGGAVRSALENFTALDSDGGKMLRINIRDVLRRHAIADTEDGLYCLTISTPDNKIPARIAFGMNYSNRGLGCNINHSVWINPAYGQRKRLYVWGALIKQTGTVNWIVASHLDKKKISAEEADVTVKLYNGSGVIVQKSFHTRTRTSLVIKLEDLLQETSSVPAEGEIIWYTLESSCPNYGSIQLHVDASGFVGGCHSF